MSVCMCMYMHVYNNVCVYMHACVYMQVHVQVPPPPPPPLCTMKCVLLGTVFNTYTCMYYVWPIPYMYLIGTLYVPYIYLTRTLHVHRMSLM